MRREARRFALVLVYGVATVGCASLPASGGVAPCVFPSSAPDAETAAGSLRPGVYRLAVVADEGSRAGTRVDGNLSLVSFGHVRRPFGEAGGSVVYPLRGWTDVDLERVGAPIPLGPDADEPPPTSRSEDRPGVLVRGDSVRGEKLLVGTMDNRDVKTDVTTLDGAGIVLDVAEADADGFAGTWAEWGIVGNGRGRFCAVRMGDVEEEI